MLEQLDVKKILEKHRTTVNPDDLAQYREFQLDFGHETNYEGLFVPCK